MRYNLYPESNMAKYDYKVISTSTKDGLEKEVKQYLNSGWQLGGFAVYQVQNGFEPIIYVQTLIKPNDGVMLG